jgi:hypothetical protein
METFFEDKISFFLPRSTYSIDFSMCGVSHVFNNNKKRGEIITEYDNKDINIKKS